MKVGVCYTFCVLTSFVWNSYHWSLLTFQQIHDGRWQLTIDYVSWKELHNKLVYSVMVSLFARSYDSVLTNVYNNHCWPLLFEDAWVDNFLSVPWNAEARVTKFKHMITLRDPDVAVTLGPRCQRYRKRVSVVCPVWVAIKLIY